MSNNPYSSENPYAPLPDVPPQSEAASNVEAIRKQYISHEASVKSIGLLYYLGGTLASLLGILYVGMGGAIAFGSAGANGGEMVVGLGLMFLGVVVGGIGVFQFIAAAAIRRLKPWARIGGIVLSVIGLLGFPIGTIINGYFLYLLASQKGEYVFSDHYKNVIAATPHIKYKTSILVWIVLGLLLLLIGMAIAAAFVGSAA